MVLFLPAAVLALFGWLIKYKKAAWLISGYNTSSKKKKAEYDKDKLCRYTGNLVFLLAGILFITAALIALFEPYTEDIALAGFLALLSVSLVGIIFLNTGGRVKKND
jgi:uncharacterized membrane protein